MAGFAGKNPLPASIDLSPDKITEAKRHLYALVHAAKNDTIVPLTYDGVLYEVLRALDVKMIKE